MSAYDKLCKDLHYKGGYCVSIVSQCLRQKTIAGGRFQKVNLTCWKESDTCACYNRGEKLGNRFSQDSAEKGILTWYCNAARTHLSDPHPVLVDWAHEIFQEISTGMFGKVSDVKQCLNIKGPSKARVPTREGVEDSNVPTWMDVLKDIQENEASFANESETVKKAIIDARLGQGKFRESLMMVWAGKCAVTKCTSKTMLRASHIKRWSESSNAERLDRFNGLLLIPNLDTAFDRGLISFSDSGQIIISAQLTEGDQEILGIRKDQRLCCVFDQNKPYLSYHRRSWKLGD